MKFLANNCINTRASGIGNFSASRIPMRRATKMLRLVGIAILVLLQLQQVVGFNSESRYKFGGELCRKVSASKEHENIILSPASVQTCMALAYMGAEGKTEEELKKALFLESFAKKEDVAADYGEFLQAASKSESSKLQMANRIYLGKDYEISPEYSELAAKHFHSKAELVDFADNKAAAGKINDWVKSETHDKIQNLIQPSALGGDTAAVLVNAIYFKAEWQQQFHPHITKPMDFNLSEKEQQQVPTMYKSGVEVRYCEVPALDMVAVELPYKDTDLSMLIMLPKAVNGLAELEKKFDLALLQQLDKELAKTTLDIFLPKFKIEFDLSLVETLKSMGITALFGNDANLHGILKTEKPLKVSEVKHKAFISVDENGSEAAAATSLHITTYSARLNPTVLHVDHPFLFAIRDQHALYFYGHVVKL